MKPSMKKKISRMETNMVPPYFFLLKVNVMLIEVPSAITKSEDPRRFTILKGKPYLDSGNYRHGFVVTKRKTVKAGTYVLVVSTFHRGQLGVFQLKVTSSKKVALRTLT